MHHKIFITCSLCVFLGLILSLALYQPLEARNTKNILQQADALVEKGELKDYKQAFELYKKAVNIYPDCYQANWKAARAHHFAGIHAKHTQKKDWKKTCIHHGEKGMEYAQKAIDLNPQGVQGHLYYALCAGVYSDGVSLVTALAQGLQEKVQKHLQKAYELDKNYRDGIPALALGRYWEELPWLAGRDREKALQYYQEADRIMPEDSRHRPELNFYLGGLLLQMDKEQEMALHLLQQAANSDHQHFSRKAQELLEDYQASSKVSGN